MDNRNHLEPIARRKNPSFSSSLLDEIYRSFDDQTTPAASRATQGDDHKTDRIGKETDQNVDRNRMLFNKVDGRKKSAHFPQSFHLNSWSTSSDSSLWTSSESETSKTSFGQSKLAIRASFDDRIYVSQRKLENASEGFAKAKSKALKTHGDLKKSKPNQPLSPGSRLSGFLSSLFNTSTGTGKKTKTDTSVKASSACSSASRSCFSKTPSSRGKLSDNNSVKRSVRFYPVISVIKDEDCRYSDNGRPNQDNILARNLMRENNRRARQVLKNCGKKLEEREMMNDDEDCESCASSDLFELDNLDSERYSEELPVYETTSLHANRAIAHGLLM